jgi:hypothetical protein
MAVTMVLIIVSSFTAWRWELVHTTTQVRSSLVCKNRESFLNSVRCLVYSECSGSIYNFILFEISCLGNFSIVSRTIYNEK